MIQNTKYDLIIIGAGAAGLTAAIYASRRELKTLVLSMNLGGQAAMASDIENYPGSETKSGVELMKKFAEAAKKFGAEIVYDEATSIKKIDDGFEVTAKREKYQSKTIIIASGKKPRLLNAKGEGKFHGKGIVYCATCDAPLFRDKDVAVVGGGNSAFDAAILLTKIAKKVYLIHRREEFRAEESDVEKFKKKNNIELVLNCEITEIKGDDFIKSVIVKNNQDGSEKEIMLSGLFVEIGYDVDPKLFKDLVKMDEVNQIKTDSCGRTSTSGIFAAGDITDVPYKQIVISAGAGAKAALCAYDYINKNKK